jgi:Methyltransferase FkbM domain
MENILKLVSEGSATLYFEKELGWTGILVEPNLVSAKKLEKNRPNSIVRYTPISTEPTVYFHSYHADSADMSAIEDTVTDDISVVYYNDEIVLNEKRTCDLLETKTLADIVTEPYDFMVIDVNGHELEVLESWDFFYDISFIIYHNKPLDKDRSNECEKILKNNKYIFVDTVLIHNQMFDVWKKEPKESCIVS